jgi:preprotein translocase subunit SecB
MNNHPIQLVKIDTKELSVVINDLKITKEKNLEAQVTYKMGFNQFDVEEKVLTVGFKCLLNEDVDEAPFQITVELIGVFTIGDEFPSDKIENFAKGNAPLILMPYIRESIYTLSSRTGLDIILPLVQVPARQKNV